VNYLLSPHDDDSALFAAAICMREPLTVVVVADSYVQPARGDVGCSPAERAAETERAHAILGCGTLRLGLHDDDLEFEEVRNALSPVLRDADHLYVPALEGGHPHHDLVARAAVDDKHVDRVRCYSTYAKLSQYGSADLQPVGTEEIVLTADEADRKMAALRCYESQIRVNLPHFQAVTGRNEWLSGYRRVHLGCGEQLKPGWLNFDRVCARPDVYRLDCAIEDLTTVIEPHSADYVFSEDFLEHIPPDRRVHVINQCWAILKPGGIMEHFVPNAGSRNDYGSPTHVSHWNLQTFEHFDVDSYRWAKDRVFEGIVGGFTKVSAELLHVIEEEDGVRRAQSLRVRYRAVATC
jgi:predicted SAM-dependent methyltransferase